MYDDVFHKEIVVSPIPVYFYVSGGFLRVNRSVQTKYGAATDVQLSFYRPATWFLDMSVGVLWFIAFFCVSVGSVWAAASVYHDRQAVRNLVSREALTGDAEAGTTSSSGRASTETSGTTAGRNKKSKEETQKEIAQMSCFAHVIYVGVAVVIVVAVLLLAFFFRSYAGNLCRKITNNASFSVVLQHNARRAGHVLRPPMRLRAALPCPERRSALLAS